MHNMIGIEVEQQLKHLQLPSEHDYTLLIPEKNIGICEVNGNNPTRSQEDTVAVDASDETATFMDMPQDQKTRIATATFANLQHKLTKKGFIEGSCVCVASGHVKNGQATVFTSYVGDSVGFLIVLKEDGTLRSVTPCNTELHTGYNQDECHAIQHGIGREPGVISPDAYGTPRLAGALAITRTLGDIEFDDQGLSHVPQTTTVTAEVAPDDRVYMVLTCDGAMEHWEGKSSVKQFANELGNLFQQYHQLSPEILAEKIVDNALEKGSMDNITAMVVPLGKYAVTAGVFDGHAGPEAANYLRDHYIKEFRKNIRGLKSSVTQFFMQVLEAKHVFTKDEVTGLPPSLSCVVL